MCHETDTQKLNFSDNLKTNFESIVTVPGVNAFDLQRAVNERTWMPTANTMELI